VNPERLVCGLATLFDVPAGDDGLTWRAADFADFVSAGAGVPMLVDHRLPLEPSEALGTWFGFAVLAEGTTPAGLLAIGEFGHTPAGEGWLRMLGETVRWWDPRDPPPWGLSVRAGDASEAGDGSRRWLTEVSLTRKPAWSDARVLGVGEHAASVWELLTGNPPPAYTAVAPRVIRRRLLGATRGGKPIYDDMGG
jgi:hypothetical protein